MTEPGMAKILLVEDDEMSRDMLSRRLARQGYQVVVAVDAREGLALARSESPDVILMDMNLPGRDGWEATRQLKVASQTRTIPIIAVTGYDVAGDREMARDLGFDDYETKPIDFPRLLEKIAAVLRREATP